MPGLAAACNPNLHVPKGAIYLYSQSWLISTVVTAGVYWVLHRIRPMPISRIGDEDDKFIDGVTMENDAATESSSERHGKAFDV